jgi:AcrR family transcriptional regulator
VTVASVRSPPVDTPARSQRLPRQARREHFLDVAGRLVADGGVEAITMEGVAAAAGVSKGLGYAYFSNAGDLLLALLERELGRLSRSIEESVKAAEGYEAKTRAAIHSWFDAIAEQGPLLGPLMQADIGRGPAEQARKAYYRRMESWWGAYAERELGVPKREATIVSAMFIAGTRGLLERWVECRDSRKVLENTYVRAVMAVMRDLADGPA